LIHPTTHFAHFPQVLAIVANPSFCVSHVIACRRVCVVPYWRLFSTRTVSNYLDVDGGSFDLSRAAVRHRGSGGVARRLEPAHRHGCLSPPQCSSEKSRARPEKA